MIKIICGFQNGSYSFFDYEYNKKTIQYVSDCYTIQVTKKY